MARVLRLLLGLLACALVLGASMTARAAVPFAGVWSYNGGSYGDPGSQGSNFGSAQSACDAYRSARQAAIPGWTFGSFTLGAAASPANVYGDYKCSGMASSSAGGPMNIGPFEAGVYQTAGTTCPANSTAGSGGCTCNTGFQESAGACIPAKSELEEFCQSNADRKNTFPQYGTIGAQSASPSVSCYKPSPPFPGADAAKGCATTLVDFLKAPRDGDNALMDWSGTGRMTGATCEDAAATDSAPKAQDDPCPSGFPGTVGGKTVCIPKEPDKGIEGVKTSSSTDADGTKKDVKEATKCEGAVCTTTTTTTTTTSSNSSSTSTTTKTESIDDKCQKDPANKVCTATGGGKGAAGKGECEANPSKAGCGGAAAELGELYTGKGTTMESVLTQAKNTMAQSPIGQGMGGFLTVSGGGSCPSSVWSIPYFNRTYEPMSYCSQTAQNMFGIIKVVLLLCASYAAFRIAVLT